MLQIRSCYYTFLLRSTTHSTAGSRIIISIKVKNYQIIFQIARKTYDTPTIVVKMNFKRLIFVQYR